MGVSPYQPLSTSGNCRPLMLDFAAWVRFLCSNLWNRMSITLFSLAAFLLSIFLYFRKLPSIPSIPVAKPHSFFFGNAADFSKNPIQYLISQRRIHGDIFLVDLVVIRFVFVLGPEGTNAIFKGTERSGISQLASLKILLGSAVEKCIFPLVLN